MSDRLFVGDLEDKMMNRMIEEPPTMETNLDLSLSLSLGNNNMVRESSSNLTFKSLKAYEDSRVAPKPVENSNGQEMMMLKQHQFPCKYCDKTFPSTQALNGHQNAHRGEIFLSRIKKENDHMTASGLGARVCPYPAMANHLPFHGSPLYHGAHMQPMTQMSAMPWRHFGPGYGNQGLHRRSLSAHQFGTTSNSLGESAEIPTLYRRNVGFGYELDQFPTPHAVDATNRARIARADLRGLK